MMKIRLRLISSDPLVLAEVPGVVREIKNLIKKEFFFSLCYSRDTYGFPKKNVSQFGPAVLPAIANIYDIKCAEI